MSRASPRVRNAALLVCLVATSFLPGPATTRAGTGPAQGGWVVEENKLPGTSAWRLTPGTPRRIRGYADAVSAEPGDTVTLYVTTKSRRFHVWAYRLGWYQGLGGRLIWTSAKVGGVEQPPAVVSPETNMVEAPWSRSLTFEVGTGWVQGVYLLKLVAGGGAQNYVPLTIRDDSSHADLVIQNQVTTWQAYNRWGGYNLYKGPDGKFPTRSRVVSFDRPYKSPGGGALRELPMIALVERLGLDITYWTDLDLHRRPELLLNHRSLVVLQHDEYWSSAMRAGALNARAEGVNIAIFGANTMYRHVRFEDSPVGADRRMVCYKIAGEDPLYGVNDEEVTTQWREPPVPRPESELNGGLYRCNPAHADMVAVEPSSWIFVGTGLEDGSHIADVVGVEYDRVTASAPTPRSVQILAHSPLVCGGLPDTADVTYYTTSTGAGVLDAGTTGWVEALRCEPPVASTSCRPEIEQITENVLAAFASEPAGWQHPSVPNLSRWGIVLEHPLDP